MANEYSPESGATNNQIEQGQDQPREAVPGPVFFSDNWATPTAGFFVRWVAYLVDVALFNMAFSPVWNIPFLSQRIDRLAAAELELMSNDLSLWMDTIPLIAVALVLGAIKIALYSYFLYVSGQTPGKRLFRVRVVDYQTLGYLSAVQSVGRYFAMLISRFCCYFGFLLALTNPERRALHDYIAQTRVVYCVRMPFALPEKILTCLLVLAAIIGGIVSLYGDLGISEFSSAWRLFW